MAESKSEEISTEVGLKLKEKMIFKCDLGEMKVKDCYIDETHKTEADMWGPNPSRMLGMAILGCLSASFMFCLKKREFQIEDLNANAKVTVARNEKGFWRVKKIDVTIEPKIDTPEMRKRADQCKKFFEDYCVVTQAVREGINIEVDLKY